jgi:hypothetical protein
VRILFDQGTPVPLRQSLTAHAVCTAYEMGWSALASWPKLQGHAAIIVAAIEAMSPGQYLELSLP